MSDLADFLEERLKEAELFWSAACKGPPVFGQAFVVQMLHDVSSKRQLVAWHREPERQTPEHGHWEKHGGLEHWVRDTSSVCPECGQDEPCRTLRALALPYYGHQEYRQEWKVSAPS